jgi:acetyltransferase-like isoleucine patch superfamily enzyme
MQSLKYKLSLLRKANENAENNSKIIKAGRSIQIDPEFQVIDCHLEGYNSLFGNGRIHKSHLGLFTYVQYGSNISNAHIGRFCSIGPNVLIAHGEHPMNFLSTHPLFYNPSYIKDISSFTTKPLFDSHKQVNIGSDVWIGANCYIKDGLTIADGAAIGAGSVVTKDIPAYCIVGGAPARVIKKRFDDEIIENLLALKWWNWEFGKILACKDFFQGILTREALEKLNKMAT